MNARPDAWLRQAENDLALAQLARDNGFLAWPRLAPTHQKRQKKA